MRDTHRHTHTEHVTAIVFMQPISTRSDARATHFCHGNISIFILPSHCCVWLHVYPSAHAQSIGYCVWTHCSNSCLFSYYDTDVCILGVNSRPILSPEIAAFHSCVCSRWIPFDEIFSFLSTVRAIVYVLEPFLTKVGCGFTVLYQSVYKPVLCTQWVTSLWHPEMSY